MKIVSKTPRLTQTTKEFLEALEFSIEKTGPNAELSLNYDELAKLDSDPTTIENDQLLRFYGIWARPYRDMNGALITPPSQRQLDQLPEDIEQFFEEKYDRKPTKPETTAILAHILAASNKSGEVELFTSAVDLQSLRVVPFFKDTHDHEDGNFECPWFGSDPGPRAIAQFVTEYPLLAGVVYASSRGLLYATYHAKNDHDAYRLLLKTITKEGFRIASTYDAESTSISGALLAQLKGVRLPIPGHILSEQNISNVSYALYVGACLPPERFPTTPAAFKGLVLAGRALAAIEWYLTNMTDIRIQFSFDEIEAIFRDVNFTTFATKIGGENLTETVAIKRYALILEGYGDWVRTRIADGFADDNEVSFIDDEEFKLTGKPIKKSLVRDGILTTISKARHALSKLEKPSPQPDRAAAFIDQSTS